MRSRRFMHHLQVSSGKVSTRAACQPLLLHWRFRHLQTTCMVDDVPFATTWSHKRVACEAKIDPVALVMQFSAQVRRHVCTMALPPTKLAAAGSQAAQDYDRLAKQLIRCGFVQISLRRCLIYPSVFDSVCFQSAGAELIPRPTPPRGRRAQTNPGAMQPPRIKN
jgi:hypothetical protein